MKVKIIIITIFALNLIADEGFISQEEYGAMLFANPRGIACINCHNKKMQNKILTTYKRRKKEFKVIIPEIKNTISLKKLKNILKGKSIMPSYHFTDEEIKALWTYIRSRK